MDTQHASHWRRQRLTGLLLIAAGGVFFLDQLGYVEIQDVWHYWPVLLIGIGAVRMLDARHANDVTSGLWSVLIGAWLCANLEGWLGMDFRTSWPFLLIAWGATLLLRPLVARRFANRAQADFTDHKETNDAR